MRRSCDGILTGTECVVARSCLPGAAGATFAPLRRRGVVAETDASDVAVAACGRA